jgi:RHS repeat-associated protein
MTYDGSHHYTYDAEGNITQVDGGATATYAYNALNQRVHVATASGTVEFVFDLNGKRRSFWNGGRDATELRSQYYWGSQPIAYSDGALHFQHLDWTGTMRMQSGATGAEETQYSSYPWGDGFTDSGAGVYGGGSSEDDAYHFAALDHDYESGTDHAQFRNYSSAQGRWLAPDPYDGSYDATNPQSFNRYAYVLNNPMSFIDPSGLDCQDGSGIDLGSGEQNSDPCPDPGCQYACADPGQDQGTGDPNPGQGQGPQGDPSFTIYVGVWAFSYPTGQLLQVADTDPFWFQFGLQSPASGTPTYPSYPAATGGRSGSAPNKPTPPINTNLVCTPSGCIIPGGPPLPLPTAKYMKCVGKGIVVGAAAGVGKGLVTILMTEGASLLPSILQGAGGGLTGGMAACSGLF